jgi:hypothetical protein
MEGTTLASTTVPPGGGGNSNNADVEPRAGPCSRSHEPTSSGKRKWWFIIENVHLAPQSHVGR